jgi:hypothetical protein
MPRSNRNNADAPVELAGQLIDALARERVVPRFVDGYVEEHQRYGLQVHAALYRDLIGQLQREALIAMTVRAFEVTVDPPPAPRGKPKPHCLPKKDVPVFRRKFLTALTRQQKWGIGEALDFQRDLQMYESLIARNANSRRRKAFEVSNHPFVDRRALTEVENLSAKVTVDVLQGPQE